MFSGEQPFLVFFQNLLFLTMNLKSFGYDEYLKSIQHTTAPDSAFTLARVITEHKDRYTVMTETGPLEAEILGKLRFTATSRADLPAVGDWVEILPFNSSAIIHNILPRKSVLERPAVGSHGEKQIIATNVDVALIIQAVDRDFNINRIERYLALVRSTNTDPVVLLNKIDLISKEDLETMVNSISTRHPSVQVIPISNMEQDGLVSLKGFFKEGITYCLLGSSGVGKSTLINNLLGTTRMQTKSLSETTHKGQHTTTHRELMVLPGGGILIDNPGMREVGTLSSEEGLESAFETISAYEGTCKFSDCSHTDEPGCAVIKAVEVGEISNEAYANYMKMQRERRHFEMTEAERRKQGKEFSKIVKQMKKKR